MNYQSKYLKYKNKYLQLKKFAQTGGNDDCVKFLEELKDLLTEKTSDTQCQKLLEKLLLEKTVVKKKFFENPVVIETGETIDESNIGDRIAYPNIIVKEIIDIYNKYFPDHDQPILDKKKCEEFLKSLLNKSINYKNYHGNNTTIFYSPYSQKLLNDSVIIKTGITYNRKFIEDLIKDNFFKDPIDNAEISENKYYPNILVNNIINTLIKNKLIKANEDKEVDEEVDEEVDYNDDYDYKQDDENDE